MSKKGDESRTSGSGLSTKEPQLSHRATEKSKSATSVTNFKSLSEDSNLQSEKCTYDSRFSDSGVWSGSNIQSEELSSPNSKSSEFTFSSDKVQGDKSSYMRFDSGIDVSVSQQLSELNIEEPNDCSCLNDLSSKTKPKDVSVPTNINHQKTPPQKPLLELYFNQTEDGNTQLHLAVIHKFIEVVYDLVRMVPNPDYLNMKNDDRQTPLHLAVLTRQPRLVRLLVCAGAAIGLMDRAGNTALHLAVQADDLQCVRAIIDPVKTPEVDAIQLQYLPYSFHLHTNIANIVNYDGQTCVHLAALNGSVEVLRYLLWYGANIKAKEWKGGQTCLHLAVERRDVALCMFLLQQKDLDADEMNYAGYTAYQCAHAVWDKEIVTALRDHGVDTYVDSDPEEEDSDEEMLDVSDSTFSSGFKINGGGLVNVGA